MELGRVTNIYDSVGDGHGHTCQTLSCGLGLSKSEEGLAACSVPGKQSLRTASRVDVDGEGESDCRRADLHRIREYIRNEQAKREQHAECHDLGIGKGGSINNAEDTWKEREEI
jgi:hypothetical protein